PSRDEVRQHLAELLAVPPVEALASSVGGTFARGVEDEPFAVDFEVSTPRPFHHLEPPSNAPYVVGLPRHHLTPGLPQRVLQLLALPLDPRQPLNHGQANLAIIKPLRCGDADAPLRRVDADMEVLDVLVVDFDVDAADGDVDVSGTHVGPSPARTIHRSARNRQARRP